MATAVALWDRRNLLPAEIFLLAMQSIPTKCWGRRWKNADEGKDAHDDWSMVAMIVQEYYDGYEVEFCPVDNGRSRKRQLGASMLQTAGWQTQKETQQRKKEHVTSNLTLLEIDRNHSDFFGK
jgi:hypothetical protein